MTATDYHTGLAICLVAVIIIGMVLFLLNRPARKKESQFFDEPSCTGLWWMWDAKHWQLVLVETTAPLVIKEAASKKDIKPKTTVWAICTSNTPPTASPKS